MSQQNSSESGTAATVRDKPYRVVDARNVGWNAQAGSDLYQSFDPTAAGQARMSTAPLDEIIAAHGPVRPVRACPTADAVELAAAFDAAGRKTVGSIASAVEVIHYEARNRFGPWDSDVSATAAYAQRTLIAGRPGSWESALLTELWLFGNELNLWPRDHSATADALRASGPNPRRVDIAARDRIAAVLRRWTCSPESYVEVAENLAAIVSRYADDRHHDQGWQRIADQWLQPDVRLPSAAAEPTRSLLYSKSAHYH